MTLKQWLASKDKPYEIGISLLKELGGSSTLIAVLSSASNSLNKQRLKNKLEELASATGSNKQENQSKAIESPKPVDAPEELNHVYTTKLGAFKKMAAIHQELIHISGNSQKAIDARYKLVLEILRLDELNESCWDIIHYYKEHGKMPPDNTKFDSGALTIRELVNFEKTIPSYITKFNKELSDPNLSEERKTDLLKRKTEWQLKAQLIKTELDQLPILSQIKEALCLLT